MKSLLKEKVTHKKYGIGTIVDENDNRITVKFEEVNEEKSFFIPFAFENFLELEDTTLQKEYGELAVESRMEHEKEVEDRKAELLRIEELQKSELMAKKKKRVTKPKVEK